MKHYSLLIITALSSLSLYSMEIASDIPSNSDGQTKVHLELVRLSEKGGDLFYLKLLLKEDPRLANIKNNNGETPGDYALRQGVEWESVLAILKEYGGTFTSTEEAFRDEVVSTNPETLFDLINTSNTELGKKLLDLINPQD